MPPWPRVAETLRLQFCKDDRHRPSGQSPTTGSRPEAGWKRRPAETRNRGFRFDAMPAGYGAVGHAIGAIPGQLGTLPNRATGLRPPETPAPCSMVSMWRCFEARQRLGQFGDLRQVFAGSRPPDGSLSARNRIVPCRAKRQQGTRSKSVSAFPIVTSPSMDGPFETLAVGEGADRKGRRTARHQSQQRCMAGRLSHGCARNADRPADAHGHLCRHDLGARGRDGDRATGPE